MDPRGLKVTQTIYFSILTYAKYLSLVTFCATIAGVGKKWKCDVRMDIRTEGQTDVKCKVVMYLD